MALLSLWRKIAAILLALLVGACGGSGSSAPSPVGGITVTPGNGKVTVSWTATSGVEYWLLYAPTSSSLDVNNLPAGHVWVSPATSPYVVSGLTNGVTYTFAVNGRTNGGPGGPLSASVSAVPHAAGAHWVAGSGASGTTDLTGVTYGTSSADSLGYFVAVGNAGAVYKTQNSVSGMINGYSWSAVSSGVSTDFRATTYGFSKFIAVGANGGANNIMSSADLSTWTAGTWGAGCTGLNAVFNNGSVVAAVGDNGCVVYTADGTNWTTVATTGAGTNSLRGLTYSSAGLWVAVGDNGTLITSPDLVTWTARSVSGLGTTALTGVTVTSGNVYVAVGAGGTVLTSSDAATWTTQSSLGTNLLAVSTDSSQFLAVGAAGAIFTSSDAVTWTAISQSASSSDLTAIYGGVSLYQVVGKSGATIYSTY